MARLITHRELGYRQRQVLAFAQTYARQHGRTPSYDTIANALGLSSRAKVHNVVKGLEKRGFMSRVGRGYGRGCQRRICLR